MSSNYLISWYGISDLTVALGAFEASGPVLGALLAGSYDKAIILGYQKNDKKDLSTAELQTITADPAFKTAPEKWVYEIANTKAAHQHYLKWLTAKMAEHHISTAVEFREITLDHLNDTDNIYRAAKDALDSAIKDATSVTFHLSPGTPCMAFNWALVALKYPRLPISLITSSKPNEPPERIKLPKDYYESILNHEKKEQFCDTYDVIFHIFGDQRLPHYHALKELKAKEHVYIYSKTYSPDVMKPYVDRLSARFAKVLVKPYDVIDVQNKIINKALEYPRNYKIAFNITCGTKLMVAGAISASKKINADLIYLNLVDCYSINIDNYSQKPFSTIDSVIDIIAINCSDKNQHIRNNGAWENLRERQYQKEDRNQLTQALFKNFKLLNTIYGDLNRFTDRNNINNFELPADNTGNQEFSVSHYTTDKGRMAAKIIINGETFGPLEHWSNFAQYMNGGWFEEYVYQELKPLEEKGLIHDLRINVTIGYKKKVTNDKSITKDTNETYNELDLCFTDGKQLWIVSCKSGQELKTEYIEELESDRSTYGGIGAHGVLVSCFEPTNPTFMEKIKNNPNIDFVSGAKIGQKIKKLVLKG